MANPRKTQKIITIHSPGLWALSAVLMLAVIAGAIYLAFDHGRSVAGFDRQEAAAAMDELYAEIQELSRKNSEIRQQNAMLERNSQIQADAGRHIESTYSAVQQEAQELRKELEFYKSIISPEQLERSVVIQALEVEPQDDGSYRYRLVISQKGRNDRLATGTARIEVIGQQAGESKRYRLGEISDGKKDTMKFSFKYFQQFEGGLEIPDSFQPEFVSVKIKPKSAKIASIDEQFAWSELTAGGATNVGQ